MTRQEAIDVLEAIQMYYPKFNVSKERARLFIKHLMQMDFQLVMENLERYVVKYPLPPTLADIAAYKQEENHHLQEMRVWEEEAALVSREVKERFRHELVKLVKEKRAR